MTGKLTRRDVVAGIGSTLAVATLAGCSDGGNGGENRVEMTDELAFDPDELTVPTGTTVTWENVGDVEHTVTAYEDEIPGDAEYFASGGFDSEQAARDGWNGGMEGAIANGETYEHTFEVAGTYGYYCIPHQGSMTGTIVVEES